MTDELKKKLAIAEHKLTLMEAEYDEFMYIVSHDLHAPLRQIGGFSTLVEEKYGEIFDDKSKHHMQLITNGTSQMQHILDALLAYSRIHTKASNFSLIDINHIIDNIKQELSIIISVSKASVESDNLPNVLGDKEQLYQVFYLLIDNALLYQSLDNMPFISIRVEELSHAWQFCITDNGIGMTNKQIDKIFKVLRRNVSAKDYAGMGMGLATVKKIVQKHGGDTWVTSQEGIGSSFYFTLAKELPYE